MSCSLEQFKAWLERHAKDEVAPGKVRCRVGVRRLTEAILDENPSCFSYDEAVSLADYFIRNGAKVGETGMAGRIANIVLGNRRLKIPRNFVAVEDDR